MSVNRTPSTSIVPPLFGAGIEPPSTPWLPSQALSSTSATTVAECFCASATVSPTWSPWPCVTAMMSTRSGSTSDAGHFGLPLRNGST